MKQFRLIEIIVLLILGVSALSLSACNLPARATTTPTLNVTQAYQTVEARLTEAIARTPTISPTPPLAATTPDQISPSPTQAIQTATQDTTQPSASCNQASPGVPIDVTIPDDTILGPGENFTKTWRLENIGACTWTSDYALVWFSGEQLGATASVPLSGNTAPGQSADLSLEMIAPESEGTYQSWWKLRDPSGGLFGIGPNSDSAFWVQIVVEGTPITTGTPTATETSGPTLTPTTGIQVSGPATLQFRDLYDLDQNEINNGGEDLTYEEVDLNHKLIPIDKTVMAVSGPNQPSLTTCQSMNMSSAPISVDSLAGNYLCYRTNMSLPGWMYVNALDPENGNLNIEIFTWLIP